MSAVMPATGPGQAAAAPPSAPGPGFFAHHGVWAPGVRLFRSMRFTAKAVVISLAFMVPMLGLVSWLLKTQADQALASRMDATQQQVQMAHRLLVWAQGQELAGSLTRDQAQRFAGQAVAALGQNIWLRSRTGGDLPQAVTALSAPHVQGQGFVTHSPPSGGTSAAQVSYVQDFEPWAWAVGAAVPMADLRAGLARQLLWVIGTLMLAQLIAGYLFLSFYRVMDGGLRITRRHLRAMSEGDLTTSPRPWGKDESAQLMLELCRMQDSLRHMVRRVRSASGKIVQASDGIANGAADLSTRTEHAAGALQQSSLSMERIAATAKSGAEHTEEASGVARHNAHVAADGGLVMREVVDTMEGIRSSSARIGEIIVTIDGIAFQTNILALNAAVEAARAGTQGAGFAVVANEVRMLAQRSAAAAKEIKALIGGSVLQVQAGTVVVRKAGAAMHDIVAASQRVNALLGKVALDAREQSMGIGQVGQTVVELDRVTQQNATLVEQTASSASDMRELAQTLAAEVARFRMPVGNA